jgi:uncharacterized membrane protein
MPIEWGLDAVALAAALGCVVLVAMNYSSLPDTVPIHFGPSGNVDGWGDKVFAWLLPAIAAILTPMIIFLCGKPQRFNYLQAPAPENAQANYERARLLLRLLNALIGNMLLAMTWKTIYPTSNLLGLWLLVVVFAIPVLSIFLVSIIKTRSRHKPNN